MKKQVINTAKLIVKSLIRGVESWLVVRKPITALKIPQKDEQMKIMAFFQSSQPMWQHKKHHLIRVTYNVHSLIVDLLKFCCFVCFCMLFCQGDDKRIRVYCPVYSRLLDVTISVI